MDTFKKLKLFPDKWFKKYTKKEIKVARARLTALAMSSELDTGISEVFSIFTIFEIKTNLFGWGYDIPVKSRTKRQDNKLYAEGTMPC